MRGRCSSTRRNFWARLRGVIKSIDGPFTAYEIHDIHNSTYPDRELTLNEIRARLRILKVGGELRRVNHNSPAIYEVVR